MEPILWCWSDFREGGSQNEGQGTVSVFITVEGETCQKKGPESSPDKQDTQGQEFSTRSAGSDQKFLSPAFCIPQQPTRHHKNWFWHSFLCHDEVQVLRCLPQSLPAILVSCRFLIVTVTRFIYSFFYFNFYSAHSSSGLWADYNIKTNRKSS